MQKWTTFALATTLILTPLCFAKTKKRTIAPQSLIGTYNCSGFDPVYNHTYTGVMTVKRDLRTKRAYFIKVTYPDIPTQGDSGLGFLYNHHFVIMFSDPSYGIGVSIYKVGPRGNLNAGEYMYYRHSNKGMGKESCVKTSDKSVGDTA